MKTMFSLLAALVAVSAFSPAHACEKHENGGKYQQEAPAKKGL
jgi:hypothetical protein